MPKKNKRRNRGLSEHQRQLNRPAQPRPGRLLMFFLAYAPKDNLDEDSELVLNLFKFFDLDVEYSEHLEYVRSWKRYLKREEAFGKSQGEPVPLCGYWYGAMFIEHGDKRLEK